jgi:hypothetical protein
MSTHNRNISGLQAFATFKSEDVAYRIDKAIKSLMLEKDVINFNSVATKANVSKTTLYNNPDFRQRIELLREKQHSIVNLKHQKLNMTEKSKDALLAAKNKRIVELEAEVARLSTILKQKYADEYNKF